MEKLLAQAGFELAPSGYRSDALLIELLSPNTVLCSPVDMWSVKLFTTNRSSLKLVELARCSPLGSIAQSVERSDRYPEGASLNPAWANNFSVGLTV